MFVMCVAGAAPLDLGLHVIAPRAMRQSNESWRPQHVFASPRGIQEVVDSEPPIDLLQESARRTGIRHIDVFHQNRIAGKFAARAVGDGGDVAQPNPQRLGGTTRRTQELMLRDLLAFQVTTAFTLL